MTTSASMGALLVGLSLPLMIAEAESVKVPSSALGGSAPDLTIPRLVVQVVDEYWQPMNAEVIVSEPDGTTYRARTDSANAGCARFTLGGLYQSHLQQPHKDSIHVEYLLEAWEQNYEDRARKRVRLEYQRPDREIWMQLRLSKPRKPSGSFWWLGPR